jgi:hypothetical protein
LLCVEIVPPPLGRIHLRESIVHEGFRAIEDSLARVRSARPRRRRVAGEILGNPHPRIVSEPHRILEFEMQHTNRISLSHHRYAVSQLNSLLIFANTMLNL